MTLFDNQTMLLIHIALSFMALGLGCVAIRELRDPSPRLGTELFLGTGLLTTLTGFLLPFTTITPPVATGIVSTIVFIFLFFARFVKHYKGIWRSVYAITMVISVYLLVFVTVAQAFLKVPPVKALAPTSTEPPFAIAQVIVLVYFIWLGRSVVKGFHPETVRKGCVGHVTA
jgi:hypothetical protein